MTAHILVVDDENELLTLVATYLRKGNYNVTLATGGLEALAILKGQPIDLVLLDVMMADVDGFTICQQIREFSSLPIIMLTARGSEEDRVKGLQIGADDYMVKPFSLKELAARIDAALRRTKQLYSNTALLSIQELKVDKNGRNVYVKGELINTTRKEFDLLLFLINHDGKVFTREHLHERLWGADAEFGTLRTVDTHVKTLRLKLKSAGVYLKTVWGVGYKFEAPR